jgi:hypothetical protein
MRKKINVHFLHIGKTGGSAIKRTLRKAKGLDKYFLVIHPHDFRLEDVPKGEKAIFFLRDPISRFVSGFYSRKRMGRPLNNVPWKPGEKIAFEKFNTPNELAEALSSDSLPLRNSARKAMRNIYHVKTKYWYWFKNKKYFNSRINDIFFMGSQENLDNDFRILKKLLGAKPSLGLPRDSNLMHKNPTNIDKRISRKGQKNLREWYKEDYKFLELCLEKELVNKECKNLFL